MNNNQEYKIEGDYECIITQTAICPYPEVDGNKCSHCKLPDKYLTDRNKT